MEGLWQPEAAELIWIFAESSCGARLEQQLSSMASGGVHGTGDLLPWRLHATDGCANAASSVDLSLDSIPLHFLPSAVLSDSEFELLANITTP